MPSPWSGCPKPPVPNCDPGGPSSIWVVARVGRVVEVAEHDERAGLAVAVEQGVDVAADGGGFGRAAVQGVGAVACPLILAARLKARRARRATGKDSSLDFRRRATRSRGRPLCSTRTRRAPRPIACSSLPCSGRLDRCAACAASVLCVPTSRQHRGALRVASRVPSWGAGGPATPLEPLLAPPWGWGAVRRRPRVRDGALLAATPCRVRGRSSAPPTSVAPQRDITWRRCASLARGSEDGVVPQHGHIGAASGPRAGVSAPRDDDPRTQLSA